MVLLRANTPSSWWVVTPRVKEFGWHTNSIRFLPFISHFFNSCFALHSSCHHFVQKSSNPPHCLENIFPIFHCSHCFYFQSFSHCSCCSCQVSSPPLFCTCVMGLFPSSQPDILPWIISSSQMLSSSCLELRVNRTVIEPLFQYTFV